MALSFRPAAPSDLPILYSIEATSYADDEAATLEKLIFRQKHCPDFFRVACISSVTGTGNDQTSASEELPIGFVTSTVCQNFTEESMSNHDPSGNLLAIHSVAIKDGFRRRGFATKMLEDYIKFVSRTSPNISELVLIAKQHLLKFYRNCGFCVIGLSEIVHGKDPWFDLTLNLDEETRREKFWVVDSFAEHHGEGNPAAVVLTKKEFIGVDKGRRWMQMVAQEFNLSETAFIARLTSAPTCSENDNTVHYSIRFFSPTVEVDLCGHATLAASAVVYEKLLSKDHCKDGRICFHANNEVLKVSRNEHGKFTMAFPWKDLVNMNSKDKEKDRLLKMLKRGLGIASADVLFLGVGTDGEDVLVEVNHKAFTRFGATSFNLSELERSQDYSRGVIVCCKGKEFDFLSRFFAPKAGIPEDPVTGSAHCLLAPYFGKLLNRKAVVGRQVSKRGGVIECTLNHDTGDGERKTVTIIGSAIFATNGKLHMI